jgi:hypothetical protein
MNILSISQEINYNLLRIYKILKGKEKIEASAPIQKVVIEF